MLIQAWKTFVVVSVLIYHMAVAWFMRLLIIQPKQLRTYIFRSVNRHCRVILAVMGVEMEIRGSENFRPNQNYLIVANHMSYLDAILLAAYRELGFVTSVEMRETFFLGAVTELGGCIFVERRSRQNIHGEIGQVEEALEQGFSVVVFPEATSANGQKLLPFKRPLFVAAVNAGKPVLPIVIQYETLDGVQIDASNGDRICWYGDMPFASHFIHLMKYNKIRVRLTVLPEIPVTPDSTRDDLTEKAFSMIQSQYQPLV